MDGSKKPQLLRPVEVWSKGGETYASFTIDFFPILAPFARRTLQLVRLTDHIVATGAPADITRAARAETAAPTDEDVLAFLEAAYPLNTWEWK